MKLKKIKKIIISILFISSIVMLCFSTYKILSHKKDEKNIEKELDVINEVATVEEVTDSEETEVVTQNISFEESNPYWDYIKLNLINVDFDELSALNSDVKGWIVVNGTNINYPFVQTSNNDYYLTHSFDKTYNSAGWVFLDYRNDLSSFNDKNTIIYAHGRLDKTMFGTLRNLFTSNWLNNSDNYIIKLSTKYENTLWQVFSVYRIPTTSDYLQIKFDDDNEFLDFTKMLINRSNYNFNTSVDASDRILTLSTCYNSSEKIVLHAKLIKKEDK